MTIQPKSLEEIVEEHFVLTKLSYGSDKKGEAWMCGKDKLIPALKSYLAWAIEEANLFYMCECNEARGYECDYCEFSQNLKKLIE